MSKVISVGIADMKIAQAPDKLITYALGSCVGATLYDPVTKTGALVHIMLPNPIGDSVDNIYKYANIGIAQTIKMLEQRGIPKARLIAKIAGGAKMFDIPGNSLLGTIGARNIIKSIETLTSNNIKILGRQVGGTTARTMTIDLETGQTAIRVVGKGEDIF